MVRSTRHKRIIHNDDDKQQTGEITPVKLASSTIRFNLTNRFSIIIKQSAGRYAPFGRMRKKAQKTIGWVTGFSYYFFTNRAAAFVCAGKKGGLGEGVD